MSHDSNVTSNRFDFVKTPLALAVGMVFAPQVWADDGTNASFAGDPNGGSRTGIPDLQHVDAKSGSSEITYTAAGDNAGRLDISDNAEAVLSWESFDIGAGKALQILNSTSEYVLVNQVYNGATTIAGSIDSFGTAGTVVIINTAGVTISDGASIDAANLMISSSGMTNAVWVDGSLSNTGGANFGVTFDALADNGGSANIAINENLSVTGDIVIRAEGAVTIADGGDVGNVQATNIYISTDQGAVTATGNSTLSGTSSLAIDTAPGTTGGAINVKVGATELQGIDAGAAAVTLTAGGAITQSTSNIVGGTIIIQSDSAVGSSSNPIRIDASGDLSVYGLGDGATNATENDIYVRATGSALGVEVLNSDSGNVYISGDQNVTDGGDADPDIIASSLIVSTSGDAAGLETAVSSLKTSGGSVTITNSADSAYGAVAQTGAISLVTGSSTNSGETVSITTTAGDITIDGTFGSGNSALSVAAAADSGLISKGGAIQVTDLSIAADTVAILNTADQIAATGTVAIRAVTAGDAINLGTATGGLDLTAAEIAAFADGATKMVIGADSAGSNKSTGAMQVSGENVTSANPLELYADTMVLSTKLTATVSAIAGTFTGNVTSGADDTEDLVGSTITIDTQENFGTADDNTNIDVTATGEVTVRAGSSAGDSAANTIYISSTRDLALGVLEVRDSAGALNAGDTVSVVAAGHITDGGADASADNIIGAVVAVDVVADSKVGESGNLIEISKVKDAASLDFTVAGAESAADSEFAGLHVESDQALTVQKDIFSSAGVTLSSGGALIATGKTLDGNTASISLRGTDLTLGGSNDKITTTGTVNLTDTDGNYSIADTAAITDNVAAAVTGLTLTSTGGNVVLGGSGALDVSSVTETVFSVTSSADIQVSNAVTADDAVNFTANSGVGKIYGTAGVTTTAALTLDAGQIIGAANGTGSFAVSSGTLLVDTGLATTQNQSITSAGAIDLRGLTTGGSGNVAIITTNNSSDADHLTVGADIDSDATGSLTLTSNDDVIINELLDHAGALNVIAHGAGNGTTTAGDGLLYSGADDVVVTSGGALTLRGDVIGRSNDASAALKVVSNSLNLNAGADGNGAVNVTSASAIDLDSLDSTGSGAVTITTTGANDITLGGGGIDNTGATRGALTVTSGQDINVDDDFSHQGATSLVANSGAGKIYGDAILTATSSALTLQGDLIGSNAAADGALGVSSSSLNINAGNDGNGLVKVTSAAAIQLDTLDTTGSGAVSITTTGGDIVVGDGGNTAIVNAGTGDLTLTSAANVDIDEDYTHAGDVTVVANAGAGKIYGDSVLTATSSALTLQGDLIGNDANATNALVVSSSTLNINAGNAGNGLVKVTSAAAIQLDTLDTTGSGAASITTTAGDIVVGDGADTAIVNAGTGTLTLTSAANIDIDEDYTHAGDVTVVANAGAGKIYGDSILTATSSALTLQGDLIGDDADATNAFGVSSSTLNINASNNGDGLVKVTSAEAIQLDTLATTGAGAVSITTTGGDIVVGDGAGTAIVNAGTGALTLTSAANVDIDEDYTHAGDVTVVANAGAGKIYGDSVLTATSSALTLQGDLIGSNAAADAALGVASSTLNINAGNEGDGIVKVTSAAAIQLDTLDTTGSGTVGITTTAGDIQLGDGADTAIDNAGTGALTVTSAGNINVTEAFTHDGAVTLTTATTGKIYGDSILTATDAALTLNADSIDDDADATDTGAFGVVSGSLVIDGDGGTANVKVTSASSIVTGSVDVENSGGDLELTTTGTDTDITVGDTMLATNVTLTAGRNVSLGADVFAGADADSSTGNGITIVANGGGSGIGSVTQSTDLNNGLSADDISITARSIGTGGDSAQAVDIDLVNDGASQISLTLGQVTGSTYVGLQENDGNVALEYLATDTKANDVTLDTVSISFTKDVSQTSASVDETAFVNNGAGVDALTLTAGNFSSSDLEQLTLAALNTRIGDIENNLGQGWSQSLNVANVVAYIINGSGGIAGLDSNFNVSDSASTLSLAEFTAGKDAAGTALTIGSDLYNANTLLNALATYSNTNVPTLRGTVLVGGTDTTIANLDTVFAATNASGLTGITSSGLANLDGGIAVDTNKFTVGTTGNTVVAGTSTLTGDTSVAGALDVSGASTVAGITASGLANLDGGIAVDTDKFTVSSTGDTGVAGWTTLQGNLSTAGLSRLNGGIEVNTDKFTVDFGTGNVVIAGTLTVAGATEINDTFTVDYTGSGSNELAVTEGDAQVTGTFGASGATELDSTLTVAAGAALNGGITVDTDKFVVADATGNVSVDGTLTVDGATDLNSILSVDGASTVAAITASGAAALNGGITVDTDKFVVADGTGNLSVDGTLTVDGATDLNSTLSVDGASTVAGITASGAAALNGGITVDTDKFVVADGTGNVSVDGTLSVDGASTVAGITASGAAALNGGITVDTDKFVVADGTGNVSVDGTLAVDGATDLNSTLSVDGASTVAGITASGAAALNGGITVDTDKFTVSSTGDMAVAGTSTLTGDTSVLGKLGVTGAATLADALDVTGTATLTTASATSLTATTADINGGTLDGVTMGTGQIGSVVTLVDANDTSRTLATLITTQAGNVAQTAVNVTDIAAVTDVASRADTKADAIAEFRDSSGAEADAADGSDIVAAATVLRAIDATAAKANSETLGTLEDEIDSLNADNAGGNSFLTFFRNLFGTTTAAGGG